MPRQKSTPSLQQHQKQRYSWTSPDGQYWNKIDYILCSWRWRSSIQSARRRLGADCGSDDEILIAKFTLKLKKVGKTTRPFRYDLNQILYTVEVTYRFKELDLIECLKNHGWMIMTLYKRQWSKPSPRKRNAKKTKWLSEEPLQIAEKRREVKGKGEKERYIHVNTDFQRIARRDKKTLLSEQYKETEENNRMGKTRDLFMKIRATEGTFHAKMGTTKDKNVRDLTKQKI